MSGWTIDDLTIEIRADEIETLSRIGQRKPGPPREINGGGWTASREIDLRKFGQRLIAIDKRKRRHTFVEQRVRELLSAPRTAANNGVELGSHQQGSESLFSQNGNTRPHEDL